MISYSPTMIIQTSSHQLIDEQIKLLNRDPTYVPPCQIYVSSSFISMNDVTQKQYKLLQHHLSILFAKHNTNTSEGMFINKDIKDTFINYFSLPLPLSLYQRVLHEKQLVESIREHLQMNNLILRRTADETNKNTLTVKPIIVSQCSATSRIAQFLDRLIRPVVERSTNSTTFMNGADFMRKLNRYVDDEHRLQPKTNYITMKISNYYTMVSNAAMLVVLEDYLNHNLALPVIDGTPIQKIVNLTANETAAKFQQVLQCLRTKYPNVALEVNIGFKCQFLHAHIENLNGTLYSRAYHDPNIQKYTLPYVIGDSTAAHSHWFRSALIRALRYYTSVYDFD
ncbi:unnamed protein product [Rotaria sordida]|uniref:Uncharacterized protein n=1 Tax=Rotaria sordida TaxID=392033 RepID=A0A815KJY8_9BILA|nr:unnamed protein product [Rotaria sordida]CAF1396726.1 unnamed protein product [Rotaria sordida]